MLHEIELIELSLTNSENNNNNNNNRGLPRTGDPLQENPFPRNTQAFSTGPDVLERTQRALPLTSVDLLLKAISRGAVGLRKWWTQVRSLPPPHHIQATIAPCKHPMGMAIASCPYWMSQKTMRKKPGSLQPLLELPVAPKGHSHVRKASQGPGSCTSIQGDGVQGPTPSAGGDIRLSSLHLHHQ